MDLEKELRQAMAVHVKDASVPRTLASDVRRRYRRRKTRIRMGYALAFATGAAGMALLPVYQSVRATTAARTPEAVPITSSHGPSHRTPGGDAPPASSSAGPGGKPSSSAGSSPRTVPSEGGATPGSSPSRGRLATYLPAGLRAEPPCAETTTAGRHTTTCRWSGEDGWVEVTVVGDDSVRKAEDLGALPLLSHAATVHGRPALESDRLDLGRRIQWVERPGTGVIVTVAYRFRDRLQRIAAGVRP